MLSDNTTRRRLGDNETVRGKAFRCEALERVVLLWGPLLVLVMALRLRARVCVYARGLVLLPSFNAVFGGTRYEDANVARYGA